MSWAWPPSLMLPLRSAEEASLASPLASGRSADASADPAAPAHQTTAVTATIHPGVVLRASFGRFELLRRFDSGTRGLTMLTIRDRRAYLLCVRSGEAIEIGVP